MMKYIVGTDRSQINLFPVYLDQSIEHDNEVRLIDMFVNSLPLNEYGFKVDFGENGRPGYHPSPTSLKTKLFFRISGKITKISIYGIL